MYKLNYSNRKDKKYQTKYVKDGSIKTVHFGSPSHEQYIIHKDDKRKEMYINRHNKEDWTDLSKAGTWSRYILWNKPTLDASIKDMEKKFKIKIVKDL